MINTRLANIRIFLVFESILCLYRNYSSFGKLTQKCILVHVLIEISLIFFHVSFRLSRTVLAFNALEVAYFLMIMAYSVLAILSALYHSQSFKAYKNHLLLVATYLDNSEEYIREINYRRRILYVYIFILSVLNVVYFRPANYMYVANLSGTTYALVYYILPLHYYCCNLRFSVQFYVTAWGFYGVATQLGRVTKSIKIEIRGMELRQNNRITKTKLKNTMKMYNKWSASYATTNKITKLFNTMFSLEVSPFEPSCKYTIIIITKIIIIQ